MNVAVCSLLSSSKLNLWGSELISPYLSKTKWKGINLPETNLFIRGVVYEVYARGATTV